MTGTWKNHFPLDEAIGRAVFSAALHPIDYVKILVQLGHEPMEPYWTKTIFFRTRLAYPSVFSYMAYIKNQDGYMGLFRGVGYKIAYSLVNGFVQVNTSHMLKKLDARAISKRDSGDHKDKRGVLPFSKSGIQNLIDEIMRDTTCKLITLSISYPLQVLITRCCAQFVGGETTYNSLYSAISDVYDREGLFGFYAGFTPRLLGECLVIVVSSSVVFVISGLFEEKNTQFQGYIQATVNFLTQSVMYPFQLVSTAMSVNKSYLAASLLEPKHENWIDCWKHLSRIGQLKRGSTLIWRYQQEASKEILLKRLH